MCGIFALLGLRYKDQKSCPDWLRQAALQQVRTLRHRGPDWSGMYADHATGTILAHERLGLVGLDHGEQPIYSADRTLVLAVNGEIYNHKQLREELEATAGQHPLYEFQTESDCEIALALYSRAKSIAAATGLIDIDMSWIDRLEGMFGFVLWDAVDQRILVARDHCGIIPLYCGVVSYELPPVSPTSAVASQAELAAPATSTDTSTPSCRFTLQFASEMKALVFPNSAAAPHLQASSSTPRLDAVHIFPPGHYFTATLDSVESQLTAEKAPISIQYYRRQWQTTVPAPLATVTPDSQELVASRRKLVIDSLHDALCASVKSHLMCDTPYGVLLSGGLDSSIISAVAKKYSERRIETGDVERAWWPQLHSFAIGLAGSPDLVAAKKVADHIGSVHHSFVFTIQEGLDALRDVIHHVETFDVTTIRASTPMYLLARRVKAIGVKMVLSGEGADEIFGGYLYFHKAPSAKELHEETVRKLDRLHRYDCLRANKSMAAFGVEARVPFLDKKVLDVAMAIDPEYKMIQKGKTIEKQILREAFTEYLPESIAWRQKEQFGDDVGYSWIDSVKDHAEKAVTDVELECAATLFPENTPCSKEGFLYRRIFDTLFPASPAAPSAGGKTSTVPVVATPASTVPEGGKSIACSTAEALAWLATPDGSAGAVCDPSGRAVAEVHQSAE